jgi:two-component system chemotaxis sensor kinase CheA
LVPLASALGLPAATPTAIAVADTGARLSVALVKAGSRVLAVSVDSFAEERNALILELDELATTPMLAGALLTDEGRPVLVLEPTHLFDSAPRTRPLAAPSAPTAKKSTPTSRILIVDDSFTTRTLEKSILEAHGYQVSVAVDGAEALACLRHEQFGLVISDIEMPRLDGFGLLAQIKADRRLAHTPVILVTSRDRQEDQQRGLDLGAEAYIIKQKFDHQELLATIQQVL